MEGRFVDDVNSFTGQGMCVLCFPSIFPMHCRAKPLAREKIWAQSRMAV